MPLVAPDAATGFGRAAAEYERGRPGYPAAAVDALRDRLGIRSGRTVLDLAAGTGKLTRQLVPLGARLVAIEPLAAMRVQFATVLPDVPLLAGTAEAIPLGARCVDAVVVGQAFHWFNVPVALDELARILRPGGAVAMLFNNRASAGWARELWTELDRIAEARHEYRGRDWPELVAADNRFGPMEDTVYTWTATATVDDLVADIASRSWIASLPQARRDDALAFVRRFVADHADTAGRDVVSYDRACAVHVCPLLG
jgi:SAM-dependent methyltransferase